MSQARQLRGHNVIHIDKTLPGCSDSGVCPGRAQTACIKYLRIGHRTLLHPKIFIREALEHIQNMTMALVNTELYVQWWRSRMSEARRACTPMFRRRSAEVPGAKYYRNHKEQG